MKFCLLLTCILLFLPEPALEAQYYNTGQDPGSLRWMQIKTDRFRVIYPVTYGQAGIDFTRSLDDAYSKLSASYPARKFRIPVIVHSYTTQSNGYVAWAPSRIEVYPTPEQNSIPLHPNTQLAIHELTHVLQMESLNRGFTRAVSLLSGEQFPGIVSSLLPLWFLEGDAVYSESVFTASGRGRSANFLKQLRALMLEKGNVYRYDKSVNGSFKDYVPDHYQYGFQMMAWSYSRYGRSLWQNALKKTGGAPFLVNPVNFSLSNNASLSKKRLFTETFDTLKSLWTKEDRLSAYKSYEILNRRKGKGFINYLSPVPAGNDTVFAVRTSLSEPASIVLIRPSKKTERKIWIPGNGYPWFISYGSGKLCWIETHSDPRWENREWTVIKKMDIESRKVSQLSFRTRFMSASISPDGNFIAAVENTVENKNNLVIIDAWNGDRLENIPSPGNVALQRPQWDHTGKKISVISLTEKGEGIIVYNTPEKNWQTLIEPGYDDIQSSYLRNDSLFFVSSFSGIDNVYLLKSDRTISRITVSRFGASDLSLDGNNLIFSDYTSSGNNICHTDLSSLKDDSVIRKDLSSYLINRSVPQTEPAASGTAEKIYTPVPYRKWQHLFRFHSWMPFYADIEKIQEDPASIRPGFTIMTQNNLSSLVSTLGYEYSDNRHKFHSGVKWLGSYLVFESRIDYGDYPYIEKFGENIENPPGLLNGYGISNTLSLPLSFGGGTFTKYLYMSASSLYKNDNIYLKALRKYDSGQNQFTGRFFFSNYRRSAFRDIYPRWAQVIDLSYSFYPFDRDLYGDVITAKGSLYFPGLFRNNGLRIRLEAEKQSPELFILNNRASFPRGISNITSPDIRFVSGEYYMPLLYPDFNLSSLFYLTRIRTSFFYDYSSVKSYYLISRTAAGNRAEYYDIPASFRSFGIELLSDFYLLRMPFMVTAGVQASWQKIGYSPNLEMVFRIDLFGMSIGREKP